MRSGGAPASWCYRPALPPSAFRPEWRPTWSSRKNGRPWPPSAPECAAESFDDMSWMTFLLRCASSGMSYASSFSLVMSAQGPSKPPLVAHLVCGPLRLLRRLQTLFLVLLHFFVQVFQIGLHLRHVTLQRRRLSCELADRVRNLVLAALHLLLETLVLRAEHELGSSCRAFLRPLRTEDLLLVVGAAHPPAGCPRFGSKSAPLKTPA